MRTLPIEKNEALIVIKDSDIATIEALHDLLIDRGGIKTDFPTLLDARRLTLAMYTALYPETFKNRTP